MFAYSFMAANLSPDSSRHGQKLELILRTAARIFAEKGYHSTSMRDISRATKVSLAGLYHYCRSKEELLFLIQDHCFGRVLERLEERLREKHEPVERLRLLIDNHLSFFAANMAEMKVVSHEADSLRGEMQERVSGRKRDYTRLVRRILSDVHRGESASAPRTLDEMTVETYALFGMMNWIYNWYNPRGKLSVTELVDSITRLFLMGFLAHGKEAVFAFPPSTVGENVSMWRAPEKAS
jgi:AcrR family transcriptional regulator